jgi:hypothetical protein
MIARIARWDPFLDVPWVTEVGCSVPGILGLYHLVGTDGAGLSITFAENEAAIAGATEAIIAENARRPGRVQRRPDGGHHVSRSRLRDTRPRRALTCHEEVRCSG